MSFSRYPKYTESGDVRLGAVPSTWVVESLKRSAAFVYGDALATELRGASGPVPVFGSNGEFGRHDQANTSAPAILIGRKGSCGALNWTDVAAFAIDTVFYVDARSCSANLRWLYWAMHVIGLQDASQDTGVPGLPRDFSHNARLPIPSDPEQGAIAGFLDRETAKIDALVAEQERLIALLKEKRQAVISHAVTKGLDPTVPMKDSGIEWLGQVPAHWGTSRLKYVTDAIIDCPHETPMYDPDGAYLVIRTADVEHGSLDPSAMYRLSQEQYEQRTRRRGLSEGDVVYGREGERWGHAALVPESDRYCLGQRMMQFIPSSETCPSFLMWQLNAASTYRQGDVDTVGATSPHVNVSTIRNYRLTRPPRVEQKRISSYLDREASNVDLMISEADRAITLLKERRSALISAAVTGKIDVRGDAQAIRASASKPQSS